MRSACLETQMLAAQCIAYSWYILWALEDELILPDDLGVEVDCRQWTEPFADRLGRIFFILGTLF